MKKDKRKRTTTDAGIPVASDEFSLTVGPDGPILSSIESTTSYSTATDETTNYVTSETSFSTSIPIEFTTSEITDQTNVSKETTFKETSSSSSSSGFEFIFILLGSFVIVVVSRKHRHR